MGIESLCSAVAGVVKRNIDRDGILRGKVSGSLVQVAGRSYSFTVAVDIPIDDGDWVYVMLSGSRAVVVGK